MKKHILIAAIAFVTLLGGSCSNFLSYTPRNTKVVSTIEDYRDIMGSFMHHVKTPNRRQKPVFGLGAFMYPDLDISGIVSLYSDEGTLSRESYYYDDEKGEFNTAGIQLLSWSNTSTSSYLWNSNYGFMGPINLIIDGVTEAVGDDEDLRNYVKGEALLWRAYSYYKLLQFFSPYKNNEVGIPIHLESVEDIGTAMPARKTQTECFAQIIADCNAALELLKITPSNTWNFFYREDLANSMLASIYTWKAMSGAAESSDWQNAYDCAEKAIGERKLTSDPTVLQAIFDYSTTGMYNTLAGNDENLLRIVDGNYGQILNFSYTYNSSNFLDKGYLESIYNMYDDNDIRKNIYFTNDGTTFNKYNMTASGGVISFFRLAEMVLIQAEAKARLGSESEARAILNEFRNARYQGATVTESASVIDDIILERRLEFYNEHDYRWLDMKRTGVEVHRVISGKNYNLKSDDFRYTFPVPSSELSSNHNITQAPGWENILVQ